MIIGIPKEIKEYEYRVGATPEMVGTFIRYGHQVLVEKGAGKKLGFSDKQYQANGATVVFHPKEVYASEMVIKVKEPQASEFPYFRKGLILFCFLHLAADPVLTKALLDNQVIGIAYETVSSAKGTLPLLVPMSEIAGRVAIQVGAESLQINHGGKGILLGGVPGVLPANVVIIGGGVVGKEAARMAVGLGANVTILDKNLDRLRTLDKFFGLKLKTLYSTKTAIQSVLCSADLIIGAVLLPGRQAPKLITKEMFQKVSAGSVFVDVAIDQGGMAETSRPTTHGDPVYIEESVLHYCVTNMPGACALTATYALTNATLEYALLLANDGFEKALAKNPYFRSGLNTCYGKLTNEVVASDLGLNYIPFEKIL